MDDYDKYEADCQRIRKANAALLDDFAAWLKATGLADKTVKQHRDNLDFYINQYLLYEDAIEAPEGVDCVDDFLGYWFIRKASWSSPASIRSNAASLKKFYGFMAERGLIEKDDLSDLNATIKEGMPEWLETVERCMEDEEDY